MAKGKITDKMELLRQKQEQIANQIKALEAREKDAARKADTRRKVIAGALALEHAEKEPQGMFATKLTALLGEYVIRPQDRALFGLKPKEGQTEAAKK